MSRFQTRTTVTLEEKLSNLSRNHAGRLIERIDLEEVEVEQLAEILDRNFSPPPALRRALSCLADPERQPPQLNWNEIEA